MTAHEIIEAAATLLHEPEYAQARARIRALKSTIADGVIVPEEQLVHWSEYWNGSSNERAMTDALEHVIGEIETVLAAARKGDK